jgi:type I restriction enzyme R subunit
MMPKDPEEEARELIDAKLTAAGWIVQHYREIDISAGRGVAVAEFPLKPGHGEADYMLYVDGKAVGVIEAKPVGYTLTGVEPQSERYAEGLPDALPAYHRPLAFAYVSTGKETRFTNSLEENARSRGVFHFYRPETLVEYSELADGQFRNNLRRMPELIRGSLWEKQFTAIQETEKSLAHGRPRALVQMASGSGKTYMAANLTYRLVKHGRARRVLFLVDRTNLGKQAEAEFKNLIPPDDPRRLESIYNVRRLTKNYINPSDRIVITTIQRVFSMLKGEAEFDEANEEGSLFDSDRNASPFVEPLPVEYNPDFPIETFDVIITDECHRSIYNLWRQALTYFDAFIIGLTATPSKQTIGFFNQNLVMEYGHSLAGSSSVCVGEVSLT